MIKLIKINNQSLINKISIIKNHLSIQKLNHQFCKLRSWIFIRTNFRNWIWKVGISNLKWSGGRRERNLKHWWTMMLLWLLSITCRSIRHRNLLWFLKITTWLATRKGSRFMLAIINISNPRLPRSNWKLKRRRTSAAHKKKKRLQGEIGKKLKKFHQIPRNQAVS